MNSSHPAPASSHRSSLLWVYGGLMVLLGVAALTARLPLGSWSLPVAMAIATVKLVLIFYFFMRLRDSPRLTWVCAAAGFFWLAIAGALTFSDYLTRA